jgi:hypothetical protein
MYVSVENITQKSHLIKLGDLPFGTAFRVKDNLYIKPEVIDLPPTHPEHLVQVINIQNMFIAHWHKDTYIQPVRIRKAEIKYDDLYGEDI